MNIAKFIYDNYKKELIDYLRVNCICNISRIRKIENLDRWEWGNKNIFLYIFSKYISTAERYKHLFLKIGVKYLKREEEYKLDNNIVIEKFITKLLVDKFYKEVCEYLELNFWRFENNDAIKHFVDNFGCKDSVRLLNRILKGSINTRHEFAKLMYFIGSH